MSYPPSCNCCPTDTFIIFDGKPWCRVHFLERTSGPDPYTLVGTGDSPVAPERSGLRPGTRHDDAPSHVLS